MSEERKANGARASRFFACGHGKIVLAPFYTTRSEFPGCVSRRDMVEGHRFLRDLFPIINVRRWSPRGTRIEDKCKVKGVVRLMIVLLAAIVRTTDLTLSGAPRTAEWKEAKFIGRMELP